MTHPRFPALAAAALALTALACTSSGKAGSARSGSSESASRVLAAVVTEREHEVPGAPGGGGYRGSGSWYLSFEAQDGDKTVHYRFPVTQQQYYRYPEGTRVELFLLGDLLRDIRPAKE